MRSSARACRSWVRSEDWRRAEGWARCRASRGDDGGARGCATRCRDNGRGRRHRRVPTPDPVARDYLLLGLRLDQQVPGLVDGYFGPAELKARADIEELREAARLVDDATALLERISTDVAEPDRRDWLTAQV